MPAKPQIIADHQTNHGTAFTEAQALRADESSSAAVETLEQQAARALQRLMTTRQVHLPRVARPVRRCTTGDHRP